MKRYVWAVIAVLGIILIAGSVFWWRGQYTKPAPDKIESLLPLNPAAENVKDYKTLNGPEDIPALLEVEKANFKGFPAETFVADFVTNFKTRSGSKDAFMYKINDQHINNPDMRPTRIVSFNRMKMGDEDWVIVGESVMNKDRSVAFLHFGYSDITWDKSTDLDWFLSSFKQKYLYLMPMPTPKDCVVSLPHNKQVCQKVDFGKSDWFSKMWKLTGTVPDEMQWMLLAPEEVYY